MHEEDTFRRLRRISFKEMTCIWYFTPLTLHGRWEEGDPVPEQIEKLFNNHGWTYLEWREYHTKTGSPEWQDPALNYD